MHRRRRKSWQPEPGRTLALDREGRGIVAAPTDRPGRREARVEGALAGESIVFLRLTREGQVDRARVVEVLEPAPARVEARCVHYGVCGGCSLMHMDPEAQRAHKQGVLLADFEAHGLTPETVLEPLCGEPWAYRRRARLAAKWVPGKDKVVVGFREKDHRFIADLRGCEVLAPPGGELIPALADLIASLELVQRVPQIELSMADDATALVFRVLDPPGAADLERFREFARARSVRVFLQPGGLDSLVELVPESGELRALADAPLLHYRLPAHALELGFRATDFVQVNGPINRAMIDRALELLDVQPGHRVLDLFCGVGNFSLPLARRGASVIGLEGDAGLVARARANAAHNGLDQVRFEVCDLYGEFTQVERLAELGEGGPGFDRVLLDPPRSGAEAVVERFDRIAAPRVVYVACSPQTLARDAAILVRKHGYRLRAAGIIDMFPHTAHVESIALLERE